MFALFYASCELAFQPHLEGKPIVVLSSHDGCVIARSNEAKSLQVVMGVPYFKIENYAKQQGIAVFSSNYALYGDMSHRVMRVLSGFAPSTDVYSIDECFLDFVGLSQDLTDYARHICRTVRQWAGIPISIGCRKGLFCRQLHWKGRGFTPCVDCHASNPVTQRLHETVRHKKSLMKKS